MSALVTGPRSSSDGVLGADPGGGGAGGTAGAGASAFEAGVASAGGPTCCDGAEAGALTASEAPAHIARQRDRAAADAVRHLSFITTSVRERARYLFLHLFIACPGAEAGDPIVCERLGCGTCS